MKNNASRLALAALASLAATTATPTTAFAAPGRGALSLDERIGCQRA